MLEEGNVIELLSSCAGRQRPLRLLRQTGLVDLLETAEELHRVYDCI